MSLILLLCTFEPLQQGPVEIRILLVFNTSDNQGIPMGLEGPNTLKMATPLEGRSQIGSESIARAQQIQGTRWTILAEGVVSDSGARLRILSP